MSRALRWAGLATAGLVAAALALAVALGVEVIPSRTAAFSTIEAATDRYDALLARHVNAGRVDYPGLLREKEAVERVASTFAERGPRSHPEAFQTRASRFAYALNAYNLLVLRAVLEHWPIGSVHDVRGWVEPQPGFGFFWAVWQPLDGGWTNLYQLEHERLRRGFSDARLHAAISCASASCPRLRAEAFRAASLDDQLNDCARRFASAPEHVSVDHERHVVVLSSIYDWYATDFQKHASALGLAPSVLEWVAHFAAPGVARDVRAARERGYTVRHRAYDWSINAQ